MDIWSNLGSLNIMTTFAEKLKEHNKHCTDLIKKARELISRADFEGARQFAKLLDGIVQKFDAEEYKNLKVLARLKIH